MALTLNVGYTYNSAIIKVNKFLSCCFRFKGIKILFNESNF